MNMRIVLQEGVDLGRKNVFAFIPVLVSSILTWLISLVTAGSSGTQMMQGTPGAMRASMTGMAIGAILTAIISMLAHGMTVLMAGRALDGQPTDLKQAFSKTTERIVPLLMASVVVGVLLGIGFMLLVLPGLLIAFFLMFTFVALMVDELGAFESLGRSVQVIKGRLVDCLVFFLVLIALGFVFGLVNLILSRIPVVGVILGMVVWALFAGYSSMLLVIAYRELKESVATDEAAA